MFSSAVTNGHSPIKMKKVKQEHIQASINLYMKRRQITDGEVRAKRECRWNQDMLEMALRKRVHGDTGTKHLLTFSSISGDATAADQQFTRLRNFIQYAVEPYKTELRSLLYPMFVNVYLELLCNGHKTPAHKFHERHRLLVVEEESNGQMAFLNRLRAMESKGDVIAAKDIMEFRDQKFSLPLSEEAICYVMRHLKLEDNMLMLQIFSQHLKINVREPKTKPLELKGETVSASTELLTENPTDASKTNGEETKESPRDLKEVCQKICEGPQCLPSLCLYSNNFTAANSSVMCTSVVSEDVSLMSTGYEDSKIVIHKISPGPLVVKQPLHHPGRIHTCVNDAGIRRFAMQDDSWREEDCKTCLMVEGTLRAHEGAVYKTCFLKDLLHLLSCSADGTVRLWDLNRMVNSVCYKGHNYAVYDVDLSLSTNYFVSGSADHTARLWCVDRTFVLRTFVGHNYDVDCVKFHPNSTYVASGGDRTVRLWSLQDGRCVRVMHGHKGAILALAFSKDGLLLASSGEDRRVRVCDLRMGTLLKEFCGHTDAVSTLGFSPQSSLLASAGLDGCLRLWDTRRTELSKSSQSGTEGHSFPELRGAFPIKSTTFTHLHFAASNMLQLAGKSVL